MPSPINPVNTFPLSSAGGFPSPYSSPYASQMGMGGMGMGGMGGLGMLQYLIAH